MKVIDLCLSVQILNPSILRAWVKFFSTYLITQLLLLRAAATQLTCPPFCRMLRG